MSVDRVARKYVETFFENGRFPDGIAYESDLRQLQLDYSPSSLGRIQGLLDRIRAEESPEYNEFLADAAKQTFLYFLGFYCGITVAKHAQCHIRWHDHAGTCRLLGNDKLPHFFATDKTCALGGRALYMPLSPLTERLFADAVEADIRATAEKNIVAGRQAADAEGQWQRPMPRPVSTGKATPFAEASEALGRLAVMTAFMIAGGASADGVAFTPTILEGKTIRSLVVPNAEDVGLRELEENPTNAPVRAFVHDGATAVNGLYTDVLVLEARAYSPAGLLRRLRKTAFQIKVLVPYRSVDGASTFRVYEPRLTHCSGPEAVWDGHIEAFYRGVDGFVQPEPVWAKALSVLG